MVHFQGLYREIDGCTQCIEEKGGKRFNQTSKQETDLMLNWNWEVLTEVHAEGYSGNPGLFWEQHK